MQTKLLKDLVEPKLYAVLVAFADNPEKYFHLLELSKTSKVPTATVFRLVKKLVKSEIVEQVKIGKMKIYRLNKNAKTKTLSDVTI